MERVRADLEDERVPPHWAATLVRILDDGLVVPGTNLRFGLDGIVGMLVPVLGDATTAVGALSLLLLAVQRGVPRTTLIRMAINIGVDALLGSIPLIGDAFDFAWKANRKNLQLIERATHEPGRRTQLGDYVVIGLFILFTLALVVVPFVLTYVVFRELLQDGAFK